jgi:hypothetical protein
MQPAVPPGRKY